ncbi:hypothetical protein D9Q98_009500 [Chlorella vulgaris]|uniref:Uncharacterized protein n=1 Tax=Chlorella vulgaris TaxID=3077 RepID=A0A9D4TF90_CHLVU|nr:hypothetical protein D9Q98_009500 [Chlorella vulgaris]
MKITAAAVATLLCLAVCADANRDLLQADTCPKPQTQIRCGKKCVNFKTDAKHCGSCRPCPPSFICKDAGCACPPKRQLCTNRCLDLTVDPMNCGTCGNVCPSGLCAKGTCVGGDDGCGPYQLMCNAKCRNILIDRQFCGNCQTKCMNGTICRQGGCSCPRNKPNICNSVCTNTNADPKNCGFCTNDCTVKFGATARCLRGNCRRALPKPRVG